MAIRKSVLDKKYVFEYDVGQWTFGTIQVLKEKDTGKMKSCKTVPKRLLKNSSNVLSRLSALQDLRHPHICPVTDVLEDTKDFHILFDHLQGGDVQDWMDRLDDGNWLQESTCAQYIRQLVMALCHSHAAQSYHLDLRPSSLLLTTKLPDALVMVSDFGLAAVLDPDGALLQEQPNPYSVPDSQKGMDSARTSAADMWSVGAIAHALLVGKPPRLDGVGRVRNSEEDGWNDRSLASRDFVQRLLRQPCDRPTAAKALNHPWLKGLSPLNTTTLHADDSAARELRYRTVCYTLGVILLPVIVPFRDFEQLRIAFEQSDPDHDGYISRSVCQRLLLSRCHYNEAVTPALKIVDVGKTEVLGLCETACADLIVREFFAAGPTSAPLVGPFRAPDLAPRMLKRFFEAFGDRQNGAPQASVSAANIRAKLRTATAKDIEQHANVRYDELVSCLPEDRSIDGQLLTSQLSANAGRGTPLGTDGECMSPLQTESPWEKAFGLDLISIFRSCGGGSKRDNSPHSIRMF